MELPLLKLEKTLSTAPRANADANTEFISSEGIIDSPEFLFDVCLREYRNILRRLNERGCSKLVRVWNVIPKINRYHEGLEHYQIFCKARKEAFEEFGIQTYPAASAIGSKDNSYFFGFLASDHIPLQISNPMQVEAYEYPTQYGPTAPSFSRASIHNQQLYISGTASIRGHASLYTGSLRDQIQCTLENLEIVLTAADKKSEVSFSTAALDLRVYIRNGRDLSDIQEQLLKSSLNIGHIEFLEADICRQELLVEIEGVARGI